MSNKHAVHLATCVAQIAFALALAFPAFVAVPLPRYYPADRWWTFDVHATGIAMDFYGRCLLAVLVSALTAAGTYLCARRFVRRDPGGRIVALFTVWAISLTFLVIAFYAWRLAHRAVSPPSLPSWYRPG
jgi:hypothetical protein